jgi:hypothetical protein
LSSAIASRGASVLRPEVAFDRAMTHSFKLNSRNVCVPS